MAAKAKPEGIPAWMEAQALLIKAKDVVIEEAIDLLYKEIEAKRMAMSGEFMKMELEKDSEVEQGLFLVRHLAQEKENIRKTFVDYIVKLESNPDKLTAKDVEQIESAKKFLLAVEKITTLVDYGRIFASWFDSASMEVKEKSPSMILAKTSMGAGTHRAEALRYIVNSSLFNAEGLFTKEEKATLTEALTLCEKIQAKP